jgi:hypothetical protein
MKILEFIRRRRQSGLARAPLALTDQHVAALERAIRAEGYDILVDPETGEVRLSRRVKTETPHVPPR